MTLPLALVCFESLLLGNQLINRLQDLGYRVQTVSDCALLAAKVEAEKPLLVVVDLGIRGEVSAAIQQIKSGAATRHVPVLAIASGRTSPALQETARKAGADLIAGDRAILEQLPQLLDQVLQLE